MTHSVNFLSRVSTRTIFLPLVAVCVLALAACGGGGGSVTTDPVVTPVAVVAKATVVTELAADGSVKLTSDYTMSTASFSWTGADGNMVTYAVTLSADRKSATAIIGGVAAKVPEGVTVVSYTTTYPDGFPPSVTASLSFTWCPTGTSLNGAGKCMVPGWITVNAVIRSSIPDSITKRQVVVFDGITSKAYDMPTGTLHCGIGRKFGPHGGFLTSCVAVSTPGFESVTGTYEQAPLPDGRWYSVKVDDVDRRTEPDFVVNSLGVWYLSAELCRDGTGRQVPASSACLIGNTIAIGTAVDQTGGIQSAVAATAVTKTK